MDKNKVVLGLSGGVDSTVAAILLKEQGFDVTGLYFDIEDHNVEGEKAARKVAEETGIAFKYVNVKKDFNDKVVKYFCDEYSRGRTPNPCIVCNPNIKFKVLTEYADSIGAYYIATGHYGDTVYDERFNSWFIKRGKNDRKDQTYMLYRLDSETIARFLMPLEKYSTKEEVRNIAREKGVFNSENKDSQEICFIDESSDYIEFLNNRGYIPSEGDFVDSDGNVLGKHKGIMNYTVGQRKGLGIALGKPAFVLSIDDKNNRVLLGDNEDLFSDKVYIRDCFFTSTGNGDMPKELENLDVEAKIRYAAPLAKAKIKKMDDGFVLVSFEKKQRAPAPGQSVVIYFDKMVIGGGYIDHTEKESS